MTRKLDLVKQKYISLDYRHLICVCITLAVICIAFFAFPYSFGRFIEACRDFGRSFGASILTLFGSKKVIAPSVTAFSKMPLGFAFDFPETWEGFKTAFVTYWQEFGNSANFLEYLTGTGKGILTSTQWLVIVIPVLVVAVVLFLHFLNKPNNNYNVDSKPLQIFKRISDKTYRPAKAWTKGFIEFVRENKSYLSLWLVIFAFAFNLFTIVIECFAYYFYFSMSLDVVGLYGQVYKFLYDLLPMIHFIPVPVWVVIGLAVFHWLRRRKGFKELEHMENMNKGFINERPILSMLYATMGTGKTTTLTDMALSQEVIFRDMLLEKIIEYDLKFPYFPWINLERCIKFGMRYHRIYNLANCERYVKHIRYCFAKIAKHPDSKLSKSIYRHLSKYAGISEKDFFFGYDYNRYPTEYNDGLAVSSIWDIICEYACMYFMYIIRSSLLVSNYSIRSDMILDDLGNFPLWDGDFFRRDPRYIDCYSRHAHIIDYDSLRLGKTIIENNPNADAFEFGIVCMTEFGKERGNQYDTNGLDRNAPTCNRLNDFFEKWLSMCRHSSTLAFVPFIKVFSDEQRPDTLASKVRELSELIYIAEASETRLAMPCFHLERVFHDWIYDKFRSFYVKYRFKRGDNSLFMYAFKTFVTAFHNYYVRTYNQFGYKKLDMEVESGRQDGKIKERTYYIMFKKNRSNRFATDCYADFYREKALRSKLGFDDLPEYADIHSGFGEMDKQNSFNFNEMKGLRRTPVPIVESYPKTYDFCFIQDGAVSKLKYHSLDDLYSVLYDEHSAKKLSDTAFCESLWRASAMKAPSETSIPDLLDYLSNRASKGKIKQDDYVKNVETIFEYMKQNAA